MPLIEVDAVDDARLTDYTQRTDVALRRAQNTKHGLYLAESALVLGRAVRAGHAPRSVLATRSALDQAREALGPHADATPIYVGDDALLAAVTGYELHRGLVGALHRPALRPARELLRDARLVVVLENLADPTNVGAIFRSVAAIGADAVLVTPSCSDPFYRRAIRVSMGAVLQVPWTRAGDWDDLRADLDDAGFSLAAFALADGAVDLRSFAQQRPERLAVLLGAEGSGLSDAALEAADALVTIPMRHGVDSLNVAAASAVALWAVAG